MDFPFKLPNAVSDLEARYIFTCWRRELNTVSFIEPNVAIRCPDLFIPSCDSAIFFGIGHLYQGNGWAQTAGIFAVTFAGALWFSWLYKAWDNNLWVPIGLHFLMNLYWSIFQVGDNALGGMLPNVFRAATIAITVWLTLRRQRQQQAQQTSLEV